MEVVKRTSHWRHRRLLGWPRRWQPDMKVGSHSSEEEEDDTKEKDNKKKRLESQEYLWWCTTLAFDRNWRDHTLGECELSPPNYNNNR